MGLSYLELILVEGSKHIVEVSVSGINQLMSVAESVLNSATSQPSSDPQEIAEDSGLENSKKFPTIVNILKLFNALQSDVSQISENIISSVRKASAMIKASSESDAIDKKTNMMVNTLYLNTESALSHLRDSKKYLLSVCQLLLTPALGEEK